MTRTHALEGGSIRRTWTWTIGGATETWMSGDRIDLNARYSELAAAYTNAATGERSLAALNLAQFVLLQNYFLNDNEITFLLCTGFCDDDHGALDVEAAERAYNAFMDAVHAVPFREAAQLLGTLPPIDDDGPHPEVNTGET
jgi:hypothetical protein